MRPVSGGVQQGHLLPFLGGIRATLIQGVEMMQVSWQLRYKGWPLVKRKKDMRQMCATLGLYCWGLMIRDSLTCLKLILSLLCLRGTSARPPVTLSKNRISSWSQAQSDHCCVNDIIWNLVNCCVRRLSRIGGCGGCLALFGSFP